MDENRIIKIDYPVAENLLKEIEALQLGWGKISKEELDKQFPDLRTLLNKYFSSFWGAELKERMAGVATAKRILDIGSGRGESAIFLASLGHQVCCIEPTPAGCECIEYFSNKFSLPIKVYQCCAEYLNLIQDKDFDLCIFNNSFHHCDDPIASLKNCHKLLKPEGRVMVINEIFLRFYKSKKSFQAFLKKNPEKSGDYGGNEHAYYYREYIEMLKSCGFCAIKEYIPVRYIDLELMNNNLNTLLRHRYNLLDLKTRQLYFWLVNKSLKSGLLKKIAFPILKKLSLIQISLEAEKMNQC